MDNIRVIYKDLPLSVYGLTTRYFEDGEIFYTIILNSRLTCSKNWETYNHEIKHINERDFESIYSANEVECFRHGHEV